MRPALAFAVATACAFALDSCARFDPSALHKNQLREILAASPRRTAPDGTASLIVPATWLVRNLSHGDAYVTGPLGETVRAGATFHLAEAPPPAGSAAPDFVLPYDRDIATSLPRVIEASLHCGCANEPHVYVVTSRPGRVPPRSAALVRGLVSPATWSVAGRLVAGPVVRRFQALVTLAPPDSAGRWNLVVLRDISAPADVFKSSSALMLPIAASYEAYVPPRPSARNVPASSSGAETANAATSVK